MKKNLYGKLSFPVNQENLVIDPDFSVRVKNLAEGILTIRTDIQSELNSHIAIYGNGNEKNNRDAIINWVASQLIKHPHDLLSLLLIFHMQQYDLENEVMNFVN